MILKNKNNSTIKNNSGKNNSIRSLFIFFLVLFLFGTYNFADNITLAESTAVTGISLDVSALDLQVADTYTITAEITPADASNKNIIWASSNCNVAVVDNGEITAFSQGSAVITAATQDGAFTAECQVSVTPLDAVSTNSDIRVKLSLNNPSSVPFYIDGNYSIGEQPDVSLPRQFYEIKLENGILNLYYGTNVLSSGETITLKQHAPLEGRNNFLWIKNYLYGTRRYLGDMKFIISDSAIQVINHLYIEEYLWGVVPYEMSNSFPVEALKAQSVAARTYALRSMGGTNYDLIDTSAAQVYKGYHPANEAAIAAVNETDKTVLQYDSSTLVPTYYSASNGGYTEIPYHAWGGGYDLPFFIEYDLYDILNPSSPYEEVYFPVSIDAEHPITCSDNVVGTPNTGNAALYFKTAIFNSNQLQSQGYSVNSVNDFELKGLINIIQHTHDSGLSEDHGRIPNTGVNNCVDLIMATADFKVTAYKNDIEEETVINGIELDMRYFDGANDDDTYKVFNMSGLRLTIVEPKYDDQGIAGYSIYHRRYGHGIGMSQRGAQQRASSGQTYAQILSFYYPQSGAAVLNIAKTPLTEIEKPTDNSNATVLCNDFLSVRIAADTSSERIYTLPPGARIEVVQPYYNAAFHMINFGERNYFVHAGYVDIDDPVAVTGIALDISEVQMEQGSSQTLTALIQPENATDKKISWSSDNEGVAKADGEGTITAVSTGNAVITATTHDGGYTAQCSVNVIKSVTGIKLAPEVHTMLAGDTLQLTVHIQPEDASNPSVTYSWDNQAIASVDANGLVAAHAVGTAIITAATQDGEYTAQCSISVVQEMITSDIYFVNRAKGYYENIPIGTTITQIIDSVNNSVGDIHVFDIDMKPVSAGSASTGYYVRLIIDGEIADTLRIVIEGDCSPDQTLDVIDYTMIRLHILNVSPLNGIYLEAADVNDDGIIDVIDYTLVRLHILNVQPLY